MGNVTTTRVRRGLAATVAAVAGLMLAPGTASAIPPSSTIVDVTSTFANTCDCPFLLQEEVSGQVKDTQYFDQSTALVKEILTAQFQGAVTVTWTNPVSGITLSSHEADPLTIYYENGHFAFASSRGLTFHVSIPGTGTVLLDVGRVVVTRGQGITFEAGQHQELNGDTAAFRAVLS